MAEKVQVLQFFIKIPDSYTAVFINLALNLFCCFFPSSLKVSTHFSLPPLSLFIYPPFLFLYLPSLPLFLSLPPWSLFISFPSRLLPPSAVVSSLRSVFLPPSAVVSSSLPLMQALSKLVQSFREPEIGSESSREPQRAAMDDTDKLIQSFNFSKKKI